MPACCPGARVRSRYQCTVHQCVWMGAADCHSIPATTLEQNLHTQTGAVCDVICLSSKIRMHSTKLTAQSKVTVKESQKHTFRARCNRSSSIGHPGMLHHVSSSSHGRNSFIAWDLLTWQVHVLNLITNHVILLPIPGEGCIQGCISRCQMSPINLAIYTASTRVQHSSCDDVLSMQNLASDKISCKKNLKLNVASSHA